MTPLETARSMANGPVGGGGVWGRSMYSAFPGNCSVSYLSFSMGGVCRRSLTAGKILFTGRQTCSLYLVLWLCAKIPMMANIALYHLLYSLNARTLPLLSLENNVMKYMFIPLYLAKFSWLFHVVRSISDYTFPRFAPNDALCKMSICSSMSEWLEHWVAVLWVVCSNISISRVTFHLLLLTKRH